jgi:hypothetical protein
MSIVDPSGKILARLKGGGGEVAGSEVKVA